MIRLTAVQRATIVAHGERSYPEEACGLLVGRRDGDGVLVTGVEPAENVAAERRHGFEVDPRLRLKLQKALRGTADDLVGHYHSHPDGAALPSRTDLAMAYEPEMTWLILSVAEGAAGELAAFRLAGAPLRFEPDELVCIQEEGGAG